MEDARRALFLSLLALPGTARFNIVTFGSTANSLFPAPRLASDAGAMAEALLFVRSLSANMGGSELWPGTVTTL